MSLDLMKKFPGMASGAAVLFGALAAAAAPIPEMTVTEWSDAHRKVSADSGSPYPGDWETGRVPYLSEPMNCLHPDHPAQRVAVRGSAQTGKTEIGVNWWGYIVDRAPGPVLIVLPSIDEASKYNRVKLQPTIDASEKIRHKVKRENQRDEKNSTTSFKRYAGGFTQITTASSSKGLQFISVRYLILDEVSEFPLDADGRGSPIDQARARLKAYKDRAKELAASTPGMAGECRITAMYEAGDQRHFYLPCPQCGDYQILDFDRFILSTNGSGRIIYPCAGCSYPIDESEKVDMLLDGVWIPTRIREGEEPVPDLIAAEDLATHACEPCEGRCRDWQPSYHIWAGLSPFENWKDIYNRYLEAETKPLKLKTFYQQDLGLPFDAATDAPDWEKLHKARTDWKKGVMPWPACVLTGFIDVQGNRLEWGVWGWGPRVQGWLVDAGIIPIAPDKPEAWKEVDQLLMRSWVTTNGTPIRPDAWGIDTGGNHTTSVYDYCAGRAHLIHACKGSSDRAAPPLGTPKKTEIKDEYKRVLKSFPLYQVGNFKLKSDIYQGLRYLVEGPGDDGQFNAGTLHLPDWIDEAYIKQLTAEVLVNPALEAKGKAKAAVLMKPGDRREWRPKVHQPNEALDIVVGARALAWHKLIDTYTDEQWSTIAAERGQIRAGEPDLFTAAPIVPTVDVVTEDPSAAISRLAELMGNS